MTEQEVVEAVVAWVADVIPVVATNTYSYMPAGKVKGLPDVMGEITTTEVVRDDADFPLGGLQQVALLVRRLALSFMVAAPDVEADHEAAQETLRGFTDALVAGVLADHTLGARVQMCSPFLSVDYMPGFVEYAGTVGREMVVTLAIAELLQFDD